MSEETRIILEKLDSMDKNIKEMKADIHGLKEDVCILKKDVVGLKEEVSILKADVSLLKQEVKILNQDVTELKTDVRYLKGEMNHVKKRLDRNETKIDHMTLIVENELRKMIQIIAEGHADLNRKLNLALGLQADKERIDLEIQNLRIDMRTVKTALGIA